MWNDKYLLSPTEFANKYFITENDIIYSGITLNNSTKALLLDFQNVRMCDPGIFNNTFQFFLLFISTAQ